MRRLIGVCAALILLVAADGVFADFSLENSSPEGPVIGNSWSFTWFASGASFDLIALRIVESSATFESPALSDPAFAPWPASWDLVYETDTLATAAGDAVNSLLWTATFDGLPSGYDSANPLVAEFVAFNGLDMVGDFTLTFTGGLMWNITPGSDWVTDRAALVPAPIAVVLGMLGLGVAGLKLRKFV